MNVELEHLKLLPQMFEILEVMKQQLASAQNKRWFNTTELAKYLGYSKDRLYKIKEEHLIEGKHFFKKSGKILFDRVAIDSWVVGEDNTDDIDNQKRQIVDNVLSSITKV